MFVRSPRDSGWHRAHQRRALRIWDGRRSTGGGAGRSGGRRSGRWRRSWHVRGGGRRRRRGRRRRDR